MSLLDWPPLLLEALQKSSSVLMPGHAIPVSGMVIPCRLRVACILHNFAEASSGVCALLMYLTGKLYSRHT